MEKWELLISVAVEKVSFVALFSTLPVNNISSIGRITVPKRVALSIRILLPELPALSVLYSSTNTEFASSQEAGRLPEYSANVVPGVYSGTIVVHVVPSGLTLHMKFPTVIFEVLEQYSKDKSENPVVLTVNR